MDPIKRYLKHVKNPSPADLHLAKTYNEYIRPKTAKELLDITFTPEYRKYVKEFWADVQVELEKAIKAKREDELNLGELPEVAAKYRLAYEKKHHTYNKEESI